MPKREIQRKWTAIAKASFLPSPTSHRRRRSNQRIQPGTIVPGYALDEDKPVPIDPPNKSVIVMANRPKGRAPEPRRPQPGDVDFAVADSA